MSEENKNTTEETNGPEETKGNQKQPEEVKEAPKAQEAQETPKIPEAEAKEEASTEEPKAKTPEATEEQVVKEEAPKAPKAADAEQTVTEEEAPKEEVAEEEPKDAQVKQLPFTDLRPGMTVRVHERIRDISPKGEERERIQIFEGVILKIRGARNQRTMTVRKVTKGFGVEKIWPLSSPNLSKVEVVKAAKVRRGNLSYLRNFKRKLKETWMNK